MEISNTKFKKQVFRQFTLGLIIAVALCRTYSLFFHSELMTFLLDILFILILMSYGVLAVLVILYYICYPDAHTRWKRIMRKNTSSKSIISLSKYFFNKEDDEAYLSLNEVLKKIAKTSLARKCYLQHAYNHLMADKNSYQPLIWHVEKELKLLKTRELT